MLLTESEAINALFPADQKPTLRAFQCLVKKHDLPHLMMSRKRYFFKAELQEALKQIQSNN
jgi:hypothetical protein